MYGITNAKKRFNKMQPSICIFTSYSMNEMKIEQQQQQQKTFNERTNEKIMRYFNANQIKSNQSKSNYSIRIKLAIE